MPIVPLNEVSALYGSGIDGDVTISGASSLTKHRAYRELTIGAAGVLSPSGMMVHASRRIVILSGGQIERKGGAASGPTAGTAPAAGQFGQQVWGAGTGTTGAGGGGVAHAITYCTLGATGGAGGAGTAGAGASWGDLVDSTNYGFAWYGGLVQIMQMAMWGGGSYRVLSAGSGGKQGSGNGAAGTGGGGGASGSIIIMAAPEIVIESASQSIDARGGAGGAGSAAGCGGGGGGAGGAIVLIARKITLASGASISTVCDVSGGAGGASGGGAGVAGSAGTSGNLMYPEGALS